MNEANKLVTVPFEGGTVAAVNDGERVWIPVALICAVLGLSLSRQLKKLRLRVWASVALKAMQIPGDDQARTLACVDMDALPMWLATVEASRVAPAVKPALEAFQLRAARALRDHFMGAKAGDLSGLASGILARLEARSEALEARLAALEARPVALPQQIGFPWSTRLRTAEALRDAVVEAVLGQPGITAAGAARMVRRRKADVLDAVRELVAGGRVSRYRGHLLAAGVQ